MDATSPSEQAAQPQEKRTQPSARSQWSFLPLAAFTLCFYTAMLSQRSLVPQYIFNRLLDENGLPSSYSNASVCNVNKSDPAYKERGDIQAQSSLISSKVSIMEGIPQIIMVMIYGAYSDEMGRKLTILVPCFGGAVWIISICLMINLDLPFYVYYIGAVINGFSGSYGTMLCGVFSYVADSTTKEQRTFAIGMLEASLGLSMVISNFGMGFWLKASGPKIPSIAVAALLSVSPLFMFCVKESVVRPNTSQRSSSCNVFQSLKKLVKKIYAVFIAHRDRGVCLALCIADFSLHILSAFGTLSIFTIYALNEPFCWTSELIGFYTGSKSVLWQLGMAITILLLRRRISDWGLVLMSLISYAIYSGLVAAASSFAFPIDDFLMVAAAVGGVFAQLGTPAIRAICSKLVDPDEQGVIFAAFAAAETAAAVIGTSALGEVFAVTIHFYKGFVFALLSFMTVCGIAIIGFAYRVYKRLALNEYTSLHRDATIQ